MSIQFSTGLGLQLTLPDGAESIAESSAGPLSAQFSLPGGEVVSAIRDDAAASSLAGVIAWTQSMAGHYTAEYGAVEEMQGSIPAQDREGYAYSVCFTDAEQTPRRATLAGCLLPGGGFAGITLLSINDGSTLDTALVQEIVRGIAPANP